MTSAETAALPATLRLGPVELTVSDLDRSIAYYQDAIGMRLHRREDPVAALGTGGEDVVVLVEEPGARPPGRTAGLYHYALLFPTREELARVALRVTAAQAPVDGASDHGTHEAIYLPDPDGNGIELAADRPREQWPDISSFANIGPRPLDLEGLLETVAGEEPARHAGDGLRVGHLHLHVGDLAEALRFYRDGIGFEVMTSMPTAAFLAAGGYHHHLGVNTWRGEGVPGPPPGSTGLRHWTVVLPTADDVRAVAKRAGGGGEPADGGVLLRDPWGAGLRLVASGV